MNTASTAQLHTRALICERFAGHIDGPSDALFLVVAHSGMSPEARDALGKTASALGFGSGPTFVRIDAPNVLSAAEFFELAEGLDPLCMVLAGNEACKLAGDAYREAIPPFGCLRLFGRDVCALAEIDSLLQTDAGKQRAWGLLKTLPRA